jgi:conjugative transfer signal peptidase TraF
MKRNWLSKKKCGKNSTKRKTVVLATLASVIPFFLYLWVMGYTIVVNYTESMTPGLYLMQPLQTLKKGTLVGACVPRQYAKVFLERGYLPPSERCPGGTMPLLKPIAALSGDEIQMSTMVQINGSDVANSRILSHDSKGEPMPRPPTSWHHRLGDDEFFLLSTRVPRSLDSRYFGPVHRNDLIGQATLLFGF